MILDGELVERVEKELLEEPMTGNAVNDQIEPGGDEPAKEKRDTRVYYPPFNPHWN